ncbi:hypothetical protein HJC23_011129 [Cyclotella cryptica]|uniref:Uncharacterized protein n=1 Tax=Cyclotella cryptica TaxID=29204 RepID=A0ABD3Q112_9STRA|eukprot:CCRYP_012003-RA/>CCRYP_012003-RA protein AED:0.04 eAED:0.04 QI:79/-1/1/1/-1/1/1/205/166
MLSTLAKLPPTNCTTNAHDVVEAARLQARLSSQQSSPCTSRVGELSDDIVPSVSIDEGAHKYVLITACAPRAPNSSSRKTFVYSKRGAEYHRNVAEHFLPMLERSGYYDIRITGGGRIIRDTNNKYIKIFGYSYGFGRADHQLAVDIVRESALFDGYNVHWSNDGY